jgi:hypothetical protein
MTMLFHCCFLNQEGQAIDRKHGLFNPLATGRTSKAFPDACSADRSKEEEEEE